MTGYGLPAELLLESVMDFLEFRVGVQYCLYRREFFCRFSLDLETVLFTKLRRLSVDLIGQVADTLLDRRQGLTECAQDSCGTETVADVFGTVLFGLTDMCQSRSPSPVHTRYGFGRRIQHDTRRNTQGLVAQLGQLLVALLVAGYGLGRGMIGSPVDFCLLYTSPSPRD